MSEKPARDAAVERVPISFPYGQGIPVLAGLAGIGGILFTRFHSFLLFHAVAETVTIVIAGAVFVVSWHTHRVARGGYLLFLGISMLHVGIIDFLHTVSYRGMGVFPDATSDLPTRLWIAARYMQSLSLLAAPLFLTRPVPCRTVFAVYSPVTALLLAAIFVPGFFPRCFTEGEGLTPFKIASEYVIVAVLLGAGAVFLKYRSRFDPVIFAWMEAVVLLTVISELLFTAYVSSFAVSNLVGHLFKIAAYYCLYRAVLTANLERPFASLFRELTLKSRDMETELQYREKIQDELRQARNRLHELLERREEDLSRTTGHLADEVSHRENVERELSHRQQALEAVYSMATAYNSSLESMLDKVVFNIARILDLPYSAVSRGLPGDTVEVSAYMNGATAHDRHKADECPLCALLGEEGGVRSFDGFDTRAVLLHGAPEGEWAGRGIMLAVPILDESGDTLGHLIVFDGNERSFAEYEIHLIEIFARYIAHEITHVRLDRQMRDLREMKMLGRLTSGVAHEVRNPLNAIMAVVEAFVSEFGEQPAYEPYFTHLRKQTVRLSALMEDLIDLGRPVSEEKMTSCALSPIVEEAAGSWRRSARADHPGLDLRLEIAPGAREATVRAEPLRIQQVFVNLLDNALHHSGPDGARIRVEISPPAANEVTVRVIDRGPGIKEDMMERIFDPFFTTRKSGSGLGLNIVRHIVESHGGEVRIFNNDPPPGATVEVRLPAAGAEANRT